MRKDIDGSASVPEFYGKELRYKREAAGLTLKETVEGSFYSIGYLSDIELGNRRMPLDLARHVDKVLGTPDKFFERRCEDVRKSRRSGHAEYFEKVLENEKQAETIEEWAPTVFPGLLQTAPYIRAMARAADPFRHPDVIEASVSARVARAQLFEDDHDRPSYWVILHELLLRHSIVSPEEMCELLDRIVALTKRSRIIPQVLPWSAGPHPYMIGPAKILTFSDAPPLVYTESLFSGVSIDDPALVRDYRRSYDLLRAVALPPRASLTMIEEAAGEYRNGPARS